MERTSAASPPQTAELDPKQFDFLADILGVVEAIRAGDQPAVLKKVELWPSLLNGNKFSLLTLLLFQMPPECEPSSSF